MFVLFELRSGYTTVFEHEKAIPCTPLLFHLFLLFVCLMVKIAVDLMLLKTFARSFPVQEKPSKE